MTVRAELEIDRSICSGHGRCYDLAPDLFEPDEEGYGVVLVSRPAPDQMEGARMAERNCPERAVILRESGDATTKEPT